jgi:hypothetical protein
MTIAGALLACEPAASPSSSSPAASPSTPASSPSMGLSPSATPGSGLAAFGTGPGPAIARDVVSFGAGFVAVGAQFGGVIPNFGPLPAHEGRIWLSDDGISWEDATPNGLFGNVDLTDVFVRTDGFLVALGGVSQPVPGGTELASLGVWESADGEAWSVAPPVPGLRVNVEAGAVGYLSLAYAGLDNASPTLWFSSDGAGWTQVYQLPTGAFDVDAGTEGFVAVGDSIVASGDGQAWVVAPSPPTGAFGSAALDGDWVTVTWSFSQPPGQPATSWFSADGLAWAQSGTVSMAQVPLDPQTTCHEYPTNLVSIANTVVLSTSLAGPCSEGGFVVYGTTHASTDGATWSPLPFPVGTPGMTHTGSQVFGAAANGGTLVLVGELNSQAALWTNPLN